jgi:hypothetical protein
LEVTPVDELDPRDRGASTARRRTLADARPERLQDRVSVGALLDGAHAAITGRLDALKAEFEAEREDVVEQEG